MKKLLFTLLMSLILSPVVCSATGTKRLEERPPTISITESETTSGELLAVQKRQEQIHREDRLFESLSGLTTISTDNTTAQIKMYGIISIEAAFGLQNDFYILKNDTKIKDIDIYLASPGGTTFGGFAMIEVIKRAKAEGFSVKCHAISLIGSMAIPIYAACKPHRIAYNSTIFMVHPSTLQSRQSMTGADLESQTEFHDMSEQRYVSVLAEFTDLSAEEWLKKIEKDTWFSAKQAKEWGLVDEIR